MLHRLPWLAALAALIGLAGPVSAQQGFIYEAKIGALYHDMPYLWSNFQVERRSLDINGELMFSPSIAFLGGAIRPALGATVNTVGMTSKAYVDARWQVDFASALFFGLGIGAAIHDGITDTSDPDRKWLGRRVLFHFPVELGLRLDQHNSLSVYFEHISNGYTRAQNEGLDALGVRYGYRF